MPQRNNEILFDHNHDGIDRRGFEVHGLGLHRSAMRAPGRRAQVIQPRRCFAPARWRRVKLRPDQRQPHGLQQALANSDVVSNSASRS